MADSTQPEVWLRGPIAGIAPLLQPVAHSLLQCREEVRSAIRTGVTPERIWSRPGGAAAIGYHIQHAIGSLDRLFTYARGESLSPAQLAALSAERQPDAALSGEELLTAFSAAVDRALEQLRATDESVLLDARSVGRAKLPSTVLGLLFHAAEHTQRHVGQAVTTAKILGVPS